MLDGISVSFLSIFPTEETGNKDKKRTFREMKIRDDFVHNLKRIFSIYEECTAKKERFSVGGERDGREGIDLSDKSLLIPKFSHLRTAIDIVPNEIPEVGEGFERSRHGRPNRENIFLFLFPHRDSLEYGNRNFCTFRVHDIITDIFLGDVLESPESDMERDSVSFYSLFLNPLKDFRGEVKRCCRSGERASFFSKDRLVSGFFFAGVLDIRRERKLSESFKDFPNIVVLYGEDSSLVDPLLDSENDIVKGYGSIHREGITGIHHGFESLRFDFLQKKYLPVEYLCATILGNKFRSFHDYPGRDDFAIVEKHDPVVLDFFGECMKNCVIHDRIALTDEEFGSVGGTGRGLCDIGLREKIIV